MKTNLIPVDFEKKERIENTQNFETDKSTEIFKGKISKVLENKEILRKIKEKSQLDIELELVRILGLSVADAEKISREYNKNPIAADDYYSQNEKLQEAA